MGIKIERRTLMQQIVDRDGNMCAHPDCEKVLDFSITSDKNPFAPTIDHKEPQSWCRENGWTEDEIWDLSNLLCMHRACNARKGNTRFKPDGTLPTKKQTFRYRREKRAERPDICEACNAGRNLGQDEWCNACGSGPQPERFPKWRQMSPKECDHDLFYCIACTIWEPEIRRSAFDALISGGEGYE